jgi:hypothetical protein
MVAVVVVVRRGSSWFVVVRRSSSWFVVVRGGSWFVVRGSWFVVVVVAIGAMVRARPVLSLFVVRGGRGRGGRDRCGRGRSAWSARLSWSSWRDAGVLIRLSSFSRPRSLLLLLLLLLETKKIRK